MITVLIVVIPLLLSLGLSWRAYRVLRRDQLLGLSPVALRIFIISRLVFWFAFGILVVAFAFALTQSNATGEQTRVLIAQGSQTLGIYERVIGKWGIVLVPLSMISIFVSLIGLFLMGKAGLRLLPDEETPGPEFYKARARFFFLGFSLMLPPLLFSLLLAI
jgi:hypothetical protein